MADCLHEFVKVGRWPFTPKGRRYRCRLCEMTTRLYDGVDEVAMRPIYRRMSVAFHGMNVVRKDGTVPLCIHKIVQVPASRGGTIGICLRCGERPEEATDGR